MAVPGQKPKLHIQAVREGTFRPARNSEGARFTPSAPSHFATGGHRAGSTYQRSLTFPHGSSPLNPACLVSS